jgi:NADP-dependent 3-hydroxy acid dehydrogenase YdfG
MKTVLITGASSGFGLETARLLVQKNMKLILLARRIDRLNELKNTLGSDVYVARVDVTNKTEVKQFFETLPKEFEDIDILINNAGLARGANPAQDAALEDWEVMVDTNIKGLLYMTRFTIDLMKNRSKGLIINIGSAAGSVPYRGGNVYGATKSFVRHFSRNLRTDLFKTGIKVTNIEPGAANTEFSSVRFQDKEVANDYYLGWRPLKAEDIANTIDWVINQPDHVNIENIEIMPLDQTYAGMILDK